MKKAKPDVRAKSPEQDESAQALLRAALADVTPLPPANRAKMARSRPHPIAAQRQLDEIAVLRDTLSDAPAWEQGLENGDELLFLRNGLSAQLLKKLRRGHWVVQDHLDLHGLTVPEARVLTAEFLAHCVRNGLRCVRIVHGKGLGSPNREPVLKKKVSGWLAQRDEVLAYCQAPQADGGGGAVLVLLRGSRNRT
ncbi:MAG: Smr/MutS family protein [Burkholderiales bacterium]|jgi:DNA-nicking Smr family endonuclease|nr:Smr/MutS family protein [Burkholderiales bacterium]